MQQIRGGGGSGQQQFRYPGKVAVDSSDNVYFIDTGNKKGDFISPYYDPMIAKIISHGKNRKEAINHLRNCLFDIEVAGITTNLNLFKK